MSDTTDRVLGEVNGKLDALITSFGEYRVEHNIRHAEIDNKLEAHAEDINQAKGAKAALITTAAAISGFVGIAVAAAERILR